MSAKKNSVPPEPRNWLGDLLLWLLVSLAAFRFPRLPVLELDASWRMGLGYFLTKDLQWGPDVIFTYGPLGFVMGNTYWGKLFWEMVGWRAVQSFVFGAVLIDESRRLRGVHRAFFTLFVLLLGVIYEDALHMIVIALLGLRLVRTAGEESGAKGNVVASLLLGVLAVIKFTNLMLGGFAVVVAGALALHRRAPRAAAVTALTFAGTFLAGWLLCGQNPLNIPLFILDSLQISSGYNSTMGIPTPAAPLRSGLIVVGLLAVYFALQIAASPRRPVAIAASLVVAAFLYLNWKHGFLRADGHMIGFFICALVPIAGFPALLDDAPARRWIRGALLLPAAFFCLLGIEQALPGTVRRCAGQLQNGIWDRTAHLLDWSAFRQRYRDTMTPLRDTHSLPEIQKVVGNSTIDVLGFEQGIALLNKFNYLPRPVFQSYSAYTPRLARKNLDFYASDRAPEFALVRLPSIDQRLAAMDDSLLLNYFLHSYDYVMGEKGWQLWRRRADAPAADTVAPRRLRTTELALETDLDLADLSDRHTWITIDLRPTLLGRIRDFLYKSPIVRLVVTDTTGGTTRYRLPLDIGRTGFMLNPLVEDATGLMHFAGGKPARRVARIRLEVDDGGRSLYRPSAEIGLFALTPSEAGARALTLIEQAKYWVFVTKPVSVQSAAEPCILKVDDVNTMMFHAPSRLEFDVLPGATEMVGRFGYPENAYTGDARTSGAWFRVVWSDGTTEHTLFERFLDPRANPADRGLHPFHAALGSVTSGRVRLVIDPGSDPGWDWTVWTGIEIR